MARASIRRLRSLVVRRTALAFSCLLVPLLLMSQPLSLRERVEEIERVNVQAPWQESAALIDALEAEAPDLDPDLAFRVELVRARNLALAGEFQDTLDHVARLLQLEAPSPLRLRALALGVNVASIMANMTLAFTWLEDGLKLLGESSTAEPRLLGMAAYLHLRVGEVSSALDYARQALAAARTGGSARDECVALSDLALALEMAGEPAQSEGWRRQQVEACARAADPVFMADAQRGMGKSLLEQGRAGEALPWLRRAESMFVDASFSTGIAETQLHIVDALLRSDTDVDAAAEMLQQLLPRFEREQSWQNVEQAQLLLTDAQERRGQPTRALATLRQARETRARIDTENRQRRLDYLQMQFDTRFKEQQIALLSSERERQQAALESQRQTQWMQALLLVSLAMVAALLTLLLLRSRRERRRYRRLSERDGLTGLSNHQETLRLGQQALERSRRLQRPLTAVVADIDRFKQINDRHGHAAGDEVLRALGALLRSVFPEPAVIGRSGGEEFTVLIEANAEQTRFLIEALRLHIAPVSAFGQRIEYSLSYGLCQARETHETLEDILRAADLALYEAKRSGRNRVVDAADLKSRRPALPGLVVVGTGIQLGRHLSQRCLSEIEEAEDVFCLTDPAAFAMLLELRPDAIDLCRHYAKGKDRRLTYREMDEAIMTAVRAGRRVCAVFYGHPGVFADVPHAVIRKAREEGFSARMEPGISAEACLYADLGLDPGRHGVQSIEATQLLVDDRQLDNRSLVLLWQVALTGDTSCTRFHAEPGELQKLVDRLLLDYPPDHQVILYEAAHLAVAPFRAERLALRDLPRARYEEFTTLVIPPRIDRLPRVSERLRETLRDVEQGEGNS
jgi:diguanylate cyclase